MKNIVGAGLKSVPRGPKYSNKKSRKIPGFQFQKSRDFGWLKSRESRDSRDPARACWWHWKVWDTVVSVDQIQRQVAISIMVTVTGVLGCDYTSLKSKSLLRKGSSKWTGVSWWCTWHCADQRYEETAKADKGHPGTHLRDKRHVKQDSWLKCCSLVATLRVEQGPCEPSKSGELKIRKSQRFYF